MLRLKNCLVPFLYNVYLAVNTPGPMSHTADKIDICHLQTWFPYCYPYLHLPSYIFLPCAPTLLVVLA